MTERELDGEVEFGHGAVERREEKEGIVSEPPGATGGFEDNAVDGAFSDLDGLSVAGRDKDAAITRRALSGRDSGEALQKHHVVPDVSIITRSVWRVDNSGIGGKAGGADSRGAAKSVDLKAGVVGDDDFARSELGVVDGFEGSVFGEGETILFGRGDVGEMRKGLDVDGVRQCGGAEVAEFARAGCCGVEAEGHGKSVTGE